MRPRSAQRIEEVREQIAAGVAPEAEEDQPSRLLITRETVQEILRAASPVPVLAGGGRHLSNPSVRVGPSWSGRPVDSPSSARGVVTVPWRPEQPAQVLPPQAYRDAVVEIMADAEGDAGRADPAAMGLPDGASKREGLRSKLKRLVERGRPRTAGAVHGDRTAAGDLSGGDWSKAGGGRVPPRGDCDGPFLRSGSEGANQTRPRAGKKSPVMAPYDTAVTADCLRSRGTPSTI